MMRIILAMFFATTCLGWLTTLNVSAQEELPPWVNETNCPKEFQKYKGLAFCISKEDDPGKTYVIVVDLKSEGIGFEYIIARGRNGKGEDGPCEDVNIPSVSKGPGCREVNDEYQYPIMSLLNAVGYAGSPTLVIDTDYGAKTNSQGHGPEGFAVISGNRIDGPQNGDFDKGGSQDPNTNNAVRRPWLALSQAAPFKAEISRIPQGQDDGDEYHDWIDTAFGGGPWLIQDGKINPNVNECIDRYPAPDYDTTYDKNSCRPGAEQTAVALSENGRWLYFIITLGFPTTQDTAIFIDKNLHARQAIKLDGGGSTQLWYAGWKDSDNKGDKIVVGTSRWLSQYLAIYTDKGNGIEILPPPVKTPPPDEQPPPSTENGWWAKFLNWLQGTWLYQAIQDFLDLFDRAKTTLEAIEELGKNLQDPKWWAQQLQQWMAQCLGSVALPAGLAVLGWSLSRRRRR